MKKLLLITVLAGLTLASCATTPKFGVRAGANFASINGDDADSFEGKTGFHIGAVAEMEVSEKFAVQPEVSFSSQGADYSESMYTGSYNLNYVNVPVMAKFKVAEGFSLEAGPQVGFLLSAKDKFDGEGGSGDEDVKDVTKGIDFGVNLGVGYELESGLNFGIRYNLGLSELNDFGDLSGNESWKNGVIQLSVGFFF
ncbi:MAG: PorT family protein [Bacteroidetes bacterium]|nr:MAG: PorT family protein [Bacteroidota bacterium]